MPTRVIQKVGATQTLRPVAPSFAITDPDESGPRGLTTLAQNVYEPYVRLDRWNNVVFDTDKDTGFSQFAFGYLAVGPDLQLQGFLWPETNTLTAFGQSRFQMHMPGNIGYVEYDFVNQGVSLTNIKYSFTDWVTWDSGVSASWGPARQVVFDSLTAPGYTNLSTLSFTSKSRDFGTAGTDLGQYSYNFLYDSLDESFALSGVSINRNGAPTFFTAMLRDSFHYAEAVDSANANFVRHTIGPDLSIWTYWETYVALAPPADYAVTTLINWAKNDFSTGYTIQFSDAADQAAYEARLADPLSSFDVCCFGDRIVIPIGPILDSEQDFLVVSEDWTTYERFAVRLGLGTDDHPTAGDFGVQQFYRDRNNNYYGLRDNTYVYRLYIDGDINAGPFSIPVPPPNIDLPAETGDPAIRSWGFALDSHEILVNRLGGTSTLIFDSKTSRWSQWSSKNRPVWRAHQGFNWLGMGTDNYAGGATSNIVCGDDNTGVIWTLDTSKGTDDSVFDPLIQEVFPRRILGGAPARTRQAAQNSLVTLTVDLGSPVLEEFGQDIELETSDDYGKTWTSQGLQTVYDITYNTPIEWRSLGLVRAPGRLFRFTDYGATTRIDSADVIIGQE